MSTDQDQTCSQVDEVMCKLTKKQRELIKWALHDYARVDKDVLDPINPYAVGVTTLQQKIAALDRYGSTPARELADRLRRRLR